MTKFDKTQWSEKDFVYKYLEAVDIRVIERKRLLKILKSFYRHFLGNKKQNMIMDLGCGDGILTHELLKIDNSLSATLVDGSEDMLNKAEERLADFKNINFVRASFQELLNTDVQLPDFDLIISSLAIHHINMDEKRSLFNYIYSHLNAGGYFVNIDIILPPTENLEKWYLVLWKEWIIEVQTALKLKDNYEDIVLRYKDNMDNKPDTLSNQLDTLKSIGLKDVDCFYKYGIFTMYGGRK